MSALAATAAEQPLSLDTRTLSLAPGVVVYATVEAGAEQRLVELPDGRMVRVGKDVGQLLDLLGESQAAPTAQAAATALGTPWTPRIVVDVGRRLDELGVTGVGSGTPIHSPRRIEYRPPMALQLTLAGPGRLLGWVRPGSRLLTSRTAPLVAAALGIAGLPVIALARRAGASPLHTPVPLGTYMLAFAILLASMAIHELAHGAVLKAHGGTPRRFGVMLFYLLPAFFCDVTEAWRLTPRARVRVALAGIATQWAFAGTAALMSTMTSGSAQQCLVLSASACYVVAAGNLLPFLKLDGYVALSSGLDRPFLRRNAIADFRGWLAQVIFGVPASRSLPDLAWARWFGAACTITPVIALGVALSQLEPLLLPLGVVGAVMTLLLVAVVLAIMLRAVVRFITDGLRACTNRLHAAVVLTAIVVAVTTALMAVQVPRSVSGGYALLHGRSTGVVSLGVATDSLSPGTRVQIRQNGLLPGVLIATGSVTSPARSCSAPLGTLLPIVDVQPIAARCFAVHLNDGERISATGRLSAALAPASVSQWLADRFVTPSLTTLDIAP